MKVFTRNAKLGIEAVAEYNELVGTVTVLKGSHISKEITASKSFRSKKNLESLRQKVTIGSVTQEDIEFTSFSTAATFVYGGSRNGWYVWKLENGKDVQCLSEK